MTNASIWAVECRPNGNDIHVEAVLTPAQMAERPQAIMLRHRLNPDLRAGWFKGATHWTAEEVLRAFDLVEPEARRRFYDKAVNLA